MAIERFEIEATGHGYLASAEVVLRGRGARRKQFRDETRSGIWRQIEKWVAEMNGEALSAPPRPKLSLTGKPAA